MNKIQNIFQRINKAVQKRVTSFLKTKETKIVEPKKTKKDGLIKRMINRITPPKPMKQAGSQRNIPVAKYTDFVYGWGKDKKKGEIQDIVKEQGAEGLITSKGVKIDLETLSRLEDFIDAYNDDIRKYREDLISSSEKIFDEVIHENLLDNLERALKRDQRRFTDGLYDDLRDMNMEEIAERFNDETVIDKYIDKMMGKDYYDLEKRDENYRTNWVEALYNTYGENDITISLVKKVVELDIKTFMLSYYNTAWGMSIKDIYASKDLFDYLDHLHDKINYLQSKENELAYKN